MAKEHILIVEDEEDILELVKYDPYSTGVESGAGDYITNPFSPKVLITRIRAVLRRKNIDPVDETSTINIHGPVIQPRRHEVPVPE